MKVRLLLCLLLGFLTLPCTAASPDFHIGQVVYVDCFVVHEVKLYSTPSTTSPEGLLSCGEPLTVVSKEQDYLRIRTANKEGYVHVLFISDTQTSSNTPTPQQPSQSPLTATVTGQQQPTSIQGHEIGESEAEFARRIGLDLSDCNHAPNHQKKACEELRDDKEAALGMMHNGQWKPNRRSTINEWQMDVDKWVVFDRGNLDIYTAVVNFISDGGYDEILSDLTRKYGQPLRVEYGDMGRYAVWKMPDNAIIYCHFLVNLSYIKKVHVDILSRGAAERMVAAEAGRPNPFD